MTTPTDRDDLTSSFAASLREVFIATPVDFRRNPARAAMLAVEAALEDPSGAPALMERISAAFNDAPEDTRQRAGAKVRVIAQFRFALAREVERAKFAAPRRWDRVLAALAS